MKKQSYFGHIYSQAGSAGIRQPGQFNMTPMAHGGIIKKKTILVDAKTKKPYAIAGEKGPEAVVPLKKKAAMRHNSALGVLKLAASYLEEHPLASLEDSERLAEKVGEVLRRTRTQKEAQGPAPIKIPPKG